MSKIRVEHAYKVFGSRPEKAIELIRGGASREEILRRTGHVVAVNDATFSVEQGEIFVVMGLSGSGKSTLVRMLNRLFEPTSGVVEVDGEDIMRLGGKELRALRSRKISMVFQRFALFPHRTVLDNAAYGLEVQRVPSKERADRAVEALKMVGLEGWEGSYPRQLSGGMQQRVGLARALATDADILLMDEAFSALDPLIRREMQDQLLEIQHRLHKTIVFITHDLNEAMRLGDRIAMMKDGAIVQIGTAEEILTKPANDYVAAFIQDVDRTRVLTASSIMRDPRATVSPKDGPTVAMRRMQELHVTELYVVGPGRRILGVVRDRDLAEAAKRGEPTVESVIGNEYPRTEPDTPIADLFGMSAEHTLPVAVVTGEGTLAGVVPRVSLLSALGGDGRQNGA